MQGDLAISALTVLAGALIGGLVVFFLARTSRHQDSANRSSHEDRLGDTVSGAGASQGVVEPPATDQRRGTRGNTDFGNRSVSAGGDAYRNIIVTGDHNVIASLAELDGLSSHEKAELLALYEDYVRQAPDSAQYQLALGLFHLDLGLYSEAASAFVEAHEAAPRDPSVLYYLAMSECQGKRPARLSLTGARTIQRHIEAAIALGAANAELWYFLALLRDDFYDAKSLRTDLPSVERLLADATTRPASLGELGHLLRHVPVPDGSVAHDMQRRLFAISDDLGTTRLSRVLPFGGEQG